jgi:hypothetical protein
MKLLFLYGPPAAGKLTIGKALAATTGFALFHNHLIVDALGAVFPFGSPSFVALREAFWLATFRAAAKERRSLIFTFAPEPTVAPDFPERARRLVAAEGGEVRFVRLTLSDVEQERRLGNPDRATMGKLRSLDLLHRLRPDLAACDAAMPAPALTLDTGTLGPEAAAVRIVAELGLPNARKPVESGL